MVETLILSITAFIGTNIDDILINTLFFSEAKTGADTKRIIGGKYVGTGALILLSILGASGLRILPQRYIGYLGLVPICLGVREVIGNIRSNGCDGADDCVNRPANRLADTALITMANGADNIGVYIPLFAGFAPWQTVVAVCVFLVLIAVWCFLGKALADLPAVRAVLTRYKPVIVPVVYAALGAYILLKNFH